MKKDKNSLTYLSGTSNEAGESNHTISQELEKSKVHIIVEIIQYMPNAMVSKTIIKKTTGNITVSSFDAGEELAEKTSPFDSYIQIIDGTAEVVIDKKNYKLGLGEGIIIPAHAAHCFNANEQFKMISTVIKSGYED
ncbi:MAG TPA: cupin domain-containing protein [Parafilimonas sp.]|nr:cupin domain-containing protein [Parafilimonas sp.]